MIIEVRFVESNGFPSAEALSIDISSTWYVLLPGLIGACGVNIVLLSQEPDPGYAAKRFTHN